MNNSEFDSLSGSLSIHPESSSHCRRRRNRSYSVTRTSASDDFCQSTLQVISPFRHFCSYQTRIGQTVELPKQMPFHLLTCLVPPYPKQAFGDSRLWEKTLKIEVMLNARPNEVRLNSSLPSCWKDENVRTGKAAARMTRYSVPQSYLIANVRLRLYMSLSGQPDIPWVQRMWYK